MKKLISIPFNSETLYEIDEQLCTDLSIDMADLQFNCSNDKKKFYAFIYIRNTGIRNELNFSNCSFEDKEEYLKMFLTSNIEVKCSILASTWIEILSFNGNETGLPSILNPSEIQNFINRNISLVNNIHQFINSLPIYAIYTFNKYSNNMNITEFESIDDTNIKLDNFYQLTEFPAFNLLLNHSPSYEHRPVFFTKLFSDKENSFAFMRIMKNLPYMNLLNIIFANEEVQADFINIINTTITKEE